MIQISTEGRKGRIIDIKFMKRCSSVWKGLEGIASIKLQTMLSSAKEGTLQGSIRGNLKFIEASLSYLYLRFLAALAL